MRIPAFLISLMSRDKIPMIWGRKYVALKPEEKMSIELADRLRELTLQRALRCVWGHVPNEGKRGLLTALILKACGMISGVGDFLFCWADGSAFIELKFGKNKQSENQKNFELWCKENGVKYALCYSADDAILTLKSWGLIHPLFDDTINRFGSLYELD